MSFRFSASLLWSEGAGTPEHPLTQKVFFPGAAFASHATPEHRNEYPVPGVPVFRSVGEI
jgi:hypothetical protein